MQWTIAMTMTRMTADVMRIASPRTSFGGKLFGVMANVMVDVDVLGKLLDMVY